MPLVACCHSDAFQECVHVVGEMQVSELHECRSFDESLQLMTPLRQHFFLYTFLQVQLNLYKPQEMDTVFKY